MFLTINILNRETDKKISLLMFDKKGKLLKRRYLSSRNNYRDGKEDEYTFDLEKVDHICFSYHKIKSLPIILSMYMPSLSLKINKRYHKFEVSFYNHGIKKTGKVVSKVYKSDLLKYRGGKINTFTYIQEKEDNQKYKLLIAFDGQNLFSKSGVGNYTSNNDHYGSWQVDQTLTALKNKTGNSYIVFSLDNGNRYRDKDLTLSQNFGKVDYQYAENKLFFHGKLEVISKFIIEEALPDLLSKYDIDVNDISTFGSSSGGLASFYLCHRYSDLFSYSINLSPALFLYSPEDINSLVINKNKIPYSLLVGGLHSDLEVSLTKYWKYYYLENKDLYKGNLDYFIQKEYDHNEIAWRYLFSKAMSLIREKSI